MCTHRLCDILSTASLVFHYKHLHPQHTHLSELSDMSLYPIHLHPEPRRTPLFILYPVQRPGPCLWMFKLRRLPVYQEVETKSKVAARPGYVMPSHAFPATQETSMRLALALVN